MVLSPTQVSVLGKLKSLEDHPQAGQSNTKDRKLCEGRRNYISGPPGSGKTLLLILRSRTFLADSPERHVVVVNMYRGAEGRSIGRHIFGSIQAGGHFEDRVHLLSVDVGELTLDKFAAQVNAECPKVDAKNILFVIDEIYIDYFWSDILVSFTESFSSSRVLCAGLFSKTPQGYDEHPLDSVHRCPPSVQRLLYQVDWSEERKKTYVADYGYRKDTSTNGPTPLCVRHGRHDQGVSVVDCGQCAAALAEFLTAEGLVSVVEESSDDVGACAVPAETPSKPLRDCKIVVLVNIPRDRYEKNGDYLETTDQAYHEYMDYISTCTFIKTLKQKGVDIETRVELGCPDLDQTTHTCPFATWLYNFQGLEAGVVIFLPGDTPRKCPLAKEETALLPSSNEDLYAGTLLQASASTESFRPLSPFEPNIPPDSDGRSETHSGTTSSSFENLAASGPSSLEGGLEPQREIPAPGLRVIKRVEENEQANRNGEASIALDKQDQQRGKGNACSSKECGDLHAVRETVSSLSLTSEPEDQQRNKPNATRPGLPPRKPKTEGNVRSEAGPTFRMTSQTSGTGGQQRSELSASESGLLPKGQRKVKPQTGPSLEMTPEASGANLERSEAEISTSGMLSEQHRKNGVVKPGTGLSPGTTSVVASEAREQQRSEVTGTASGARPQNVKGIREMKPQTVSGLSMTPEVSEKDQQRNEPPSSKSGLRSQNDAGKRETTSPTSTDQGQKKGQNPEVGKPRKLYVSQPDLYWTRADIARFSPWDHTNIMVAGSRCLCLLILIVP